MPVQITPSLFAHILADPFVNGTNGLRGNYMGNTAEYLLDYLDTINPQTLSKEYQNLRAELAYLTQVLRDRLVLSLPDLSKEIADKLAGMKAGERVLLPGGWKNNDDGHALVYQFTRRLNPNTGQEEYLFTVFNSGAGLNYHSRKSGEDKELYNPEKSWVFPIPKKNDELQHFILRLLKAGSISALQADKTLMDEKGFYQEVLQSIHHLNEVKEVDASQGLPLYAWTGSQLSGTCSMRVFHQLLKIDAENLAAYQSFIFGFKQHALQEFDALCAKKNITDDEARLIDEGIENNLKMLNIPNLFTLEQKEQHLKILFDIKSRVDKNRPHKKSGLPPVYLPVPDLTLGGGNPPVTPPASTSNTAATPAAAFSIALSEPKTLLADLKTAIDKITLVQDPATRCHYLQQVILALPLDPPEDDIETFQAHLNELQTLLLSLKDNWLKDTKNPAYQVMALSLMSLQIDVYHKVRLAQKLPSFKSREIQVLFHVLGNQGRNPYLATNHALLDERFKELRGRYSSDGYIGTLDNYQYFLELLKAVDPDRVVALEEAYQQKYAEEATPSHRDLRQQHLQALLMLNENRRAPENKKLWDAIQAHRKHESQMRRLLNEFVQIQYATDPEFSVLNEAIGQVRVVCALTPWAIKFEKLSQTISKDKYNVTSGPIQDALMADLSEQSPFDLRITDPKENEIQLTPPKDKETTAPLSTAHIEAREYRHLRSKAWTQIAFTLAHYSRRRNLVKLSSVNEQRSLEANLFQPGLLLEVCSNDNNRKLFITQFDHLISKAICYFTKKGQHQVNSLLYVRLNFLVNRYLTQAKHPEGLVRLKNDAAVLQTYLVQSNTSPEVSYSLQQYCFLNYMAQIEAGVAGEELFASALEALFYLQSHQNPGILEDNAHRVEVALAVARLQQLALTLPRDFVEKILYEILAKAKLDNVEGYSLGGTFPLYEWSLPQGVIFKVNVLEAKIYKNGLTKGCLPYVLQNHPLVEHLLGGLREGTARIPAIQSRDPVCYMNAGQTYFTLDDAGSEVRLYYNNNQLIVQKEWTVDGKKAFYELKPLSPLHEAFRAFRKNSNLLQHSLPEPLIDARMDYWQSVEDPKKGLLTKDQRVVYQKDENSFINLDKLTKDEEKILNSFESNPFLVVNKLGSERWIELPRYGLSFKAGSTLELPDTGELVDANTPHPIHPSVAGLVLRNGKKPKQARLLVPVARFYAIEVFGVEAAAVFPAVHNTTGLIANKTLDAYWKQKPPIKTPMWNYQNSETYVSFRLDAKGEPVADTPADSLYLAYLYLASNQAEKAWKVLEACGDLQGTAQELQFLRWICQELPHILPEATFREKKSTRTSPPYVACQLKALSMACKHLQQEKTFEGLNLPFRRDTANGVYAKIEQELLQTFLKTLPNTIYETFNLSLRMDRHLEGMYQLKDQETRHLLNYYHKATGLEAKGALGLAWDKLTVAELLKERDILTATKAIDNLSAAEKSRLEVIERHLKALKDIKQNHTKLSLVPLFLKNDFPIHLEGLDKKVLDDWNAWQAKPFPEMNSNLPELEQAVNALSSEMSDECFMQHFFSYFEIATGDNQGLRKSLRDFCTHTLLATRHVNLYNKEAPIPNFIPVLCNFLYRVLDNQAKFKTFLGNDKQKIFDFAKLAEEVSVVEHYPFQTMFVYEIQNDSDDLLKTPQQIISDIEAKGLQKVLTLSVSNESIAILGDNDLSSIQPLLAEYRALETVSMQELAALSKQAVDSPNELPSLEEAAGKVLFKLEQSQLDFVAKTPKMTKFVLEKPILRLSAESMSLQLSAQAKAAWDKAIALADRGPGDDDAAMQMRLDKMSKKRAPITEVSLKALYLQADAAYTMAVTGLSLEDAKALHQNIHEALVLGIRQRMLERAAKNLKKFEKKNAVLSSDKPPIRLDLVTGALELMAKDAIPGLNDPAVVLLQHEEKLMLRKPQENAIAALQSCAELVEKIIMGGGKSKVLLPILAEKKARGDNLVVIEVPQALLPTNHAELSRTSKALFGKEATRFEFNRDSNCSSERLKELYQQFTSIMTNRGYLVSTGESIQSLELKYIEFLLMPAAARSPDWKEQVYWSEKIVSLFRNHGDCLIDEVHQGLWINKKLNYTLGEPKPLNPLIFKNAIDSYRLLDKNLIREAQNFKDDHDWTDFKTNHIEKLLKGSLASLIKRKGGEAEAIVRAYLNNQADNLASLSLTAEESSSLAYFKEQVNVLLPQTLMRRLDEHYGASKLKGLTQTEYTLAIPYIANNVPNEASRFGNELEAINYTVQMMLLKGISLELLKEKIAAWQESARQELMDDKTKTDFDETNIGQSFKIRVKQLGLTLSQVSVDDADTMQKLHQLLKDDDSLIFEILEEKSLLQIRREQRVIHSDAYNHADFYNTVQGVTGTPYNHLTYHQRLRYNPSTALGNDAYILEVMKAKNTTVTGIDYQNLQQFVAACLGRNERTRAIIDIAAFFKGVSNLQVAQEIAAQLRARQDIKNPKNTDLKHVLYFNEDQQLCALSVDKPGVIIRLASSDIKELNQKLGSKPEQRFTYFDQVHTLGTDITQAGDAHALVLVDDKITLPAFLQGAMRMRQLSQGQTEELIVPTALQNTSLDELVAGYKAADAQRALKDAPVAAKGMMDNIGRHKSLNHILNLPSDKPEEKARVAECFKDFFVETPEADLTKLYGGLSKLDSTDNILKKHRKEVVAKWKSGLANATNSPVTKDMCKPMREQLQASIDNIRRHCAPEYEAKESSPGQEVQIQKQKETKKEVYKTQITDCHDPKRVASAFVPWPSSFKNLWSLVDTSHTLTDLYPKGFFTSNLLVSKNCLQTYQDQAEENYLGAFLKPGFCTWYQMNNNKPWAMLISVEDAHALRYKLPPGSWISANDGTPLPDLKLPDGILENREYQCLREQIQFFNGELDTLSTQTIPLDWLRDNTKEKLSFFKERLMSYRPGSDKDLAILQEVLIKSNNTGFDYIASNPFKDFNQFDWATAFPELTATQIVDCQNLVSVFNQMFVCNGEGVLELQQQHQLPMQSLAYLQKHKEYLSNLKVLQNDLETAGKALYKPFLNDLSIDDLTTLKTATNRSGWNFYPQGASEEQICYINMQILLEFWDCPALRGRDCFESWLAVQVGFQPISVLKVFTEVKKPSSLIFRKILQSNACDYALAKTLVSKLPNPPADIINLLLAKCDSSDELEAISYQHQDKIPFFSVVVHHKCLPASIAYLILEKEPNNHAARFAIIKRAVKAILGNESSAEWKGCLELALQDGSQYHQACCIRDIKETMPNSSWSMDVSCMLLRQLGMEIKGCLDIPRMIAWATEAELIWLANPDTLILTGNELDKLVERCTTPDTIAAIMARDIQWPHHIALLIPRMDASSQEALAASTDSPLILNKLLQLDKPSEKLLQNCIANRCCASDKKMGIMARLSTPLPEDILVSLAKQADTENSLRELIGKSQNALPVFNAAVANPAFSIKLGLELMDTLPKESTLAMVTRVVKASAQQTAGNEVELERLFKACLARNYKDELLPILKQVKAYSPAMGWLMLKTFGKDMAASLPFAAMITKARPEELSYLANSDNTGKLADPVLMRLATVCDSRESIDLVLARPELTPQVASLLIAKPTNTAAWLETQAKESRSALILKTLLMVPKASSVVIDNVLNNPACNAQCLDELFKDMLLPSELLLIALAKKCSTLAQLQRLLAFSEGKQAIIPHILNNSAFTPELANLMLTKTLPGASLSMLLTKMLSTEGEGWNEPIAKALALSQEQEVVALLKDNKLATKPKFGFQILKQFGKNVAPQLPLIDMIAVGDEQQLGTLAGLELSGTALDALAKKVVTTPLIDTLLARADMTEEIAKQVLEKPSFSGKIGNWAWLSSDYAATLAPKASDFDSFNRILSEHLAADKDRKQLVHSKQQAYKDARNEASDTTDARTLLMLSLQELECKVYTHAVNALIQPQSQYPQAAVAAFDLHQGLVKEVWQHYEAKTSTKAEFQQHCQALVDKHSPELSVHRGYKQWLLDFVNVLLICLTLGIGSGQRQSWRFFEAKTDSVIICDKVCASSLLPKREKGAC